MENLLITWETIQGILQGIPGFDPKVVKRYYDEGPAKAGIHFFLIQYAPDEVIMGKGMASDFAAIHLQGRVRVRHTTMAQPPTGIGCWSAPLARRLENLVLLEVQKRSAAKTDKNAPPPRPPRLGRGWLLGKFYARFPEIPMRLVDFSTRWLAPRWTDRLRAHLGRVLEGRLAPVARAERNLSKPTGTTNTGTTIMAGTSDSQTGASGKMLSIRDEAGKVRPVEDRFMGITSTLWNQPRSVTLVAGNDADDEDKPCVMLLIKRKALEEIIKKSPAFYANKMAEFVQTTLPAILARNLLFRDRLFLEEVLDWEGLLRGVQGKFPSPAPHGLKRIVGRLDPNLVRWLNQAKAPNLDDADQSQIIERLNQALAGPDLADPAQWPAAALDDEARRLLDRPQSARSDCEVFRLNRLLLEAALPGIFQKSPRPFPLTQEEFVAFTLDMAEGHFRKFGTVLQPERLESKDKQGDKKGVVVYKQGDAADSFYLILSGMVRVGMDLAGGRTMINNLEADAYFGESAILETNPEGRLPTRTANVETLCNSTLLRLDREVFRTLLEGAYQPLGAKLRRERQLLTARDEQRRVGRLLPPSEPPLAIAERVMLTRNVLLIDMNKCTRCDQCVRGCAEAHDLQPRFHRANPELHFGKWEIAGACLHCLDAPCQQACPVGAITLLDDQAVQIHRDRCIGCSQCANFCPFGVIDMYEPNSPQDAPSSKKKVANKCDLCLTDQADPPCVACCPYDAARRVDPVDFFQDLKSWSNLANRL